MVAHFLPHFDDLFSQSGQRSILLPLLVPPMVAASAAGAKLLLAGGPDYDKYASWLGALGLYDAIFLLIGWAVFDFLLED